MSIRNLILIPGAVIAVMLLLAARVLFSSFDAAATPSTSTPAAATATQPELISNPTDLPNLADAAGKDAFVANCLNCHSSRYVLMQPRFPRKVWKAEVTKMVAAY